MLNLDSILAGEYAENEFRKQFTPSGRGAIGTTIEKEWLARPLTWLFRLMALIA